MRLRWGAEELWLSVEDLVTTEAGSPPEPVVELRGPWYRRATALPDPGARIISAERVRITLWVQRGTELPARLDDLGLSPGHPSYLGALPTDRMLFSTEPPTPSDRDLDLRELTRQLQAVAGEAVDPREYYAALWRAVSVPRFSLAVPARATAAFVPIGLPLAPAAYLGAPGDGPIALARDGLTEFSAGLFLDPDLADELADSLPAEADFLRWQSSAARPLTGIHAALGVDEATLIAVPDAVHRGWAMASDAPPAVLAPPVLTAALADRATWQLSWDATGDGVSYTVEDAASAGLTGAEVIWTGSATALRVTGRPPGQRWFRVQARSGSALSPWSNAIALPIPPPQFQDCPASDALPPPVITALPPDARGNIELSWTDVPGADRFTVEELAGGDDASTTIYQGRDHTVTLRGRPPGEYAYRVRAERGSAQGAWSSTAIEIVPPPRRNLITPVAGYRSDQVLQPVPATEDHFFLVPKVVE